MDNNQLNQLTLPAGNLSVADEKHAILAAIIATSDDAIISKTLEGIITSWNPGAERMFGYSEAEALGRHISLIIPPDRLSEEALIISSISQGNKVDHFETVRMAKDGHQFPISVTISPITDRSGKVVGASKIARDITIYQKANEKQGMLAAIVDSSDDTILSKTLDGIITSWNKAAEKMFGYTEQEIIGQHISIIIPPERIQEESFLIGEVSKGNKVDHFHTIRVAKDGRRVPISLTVSPIVDELGRIIGASKIARDITEQLNIEEEKARLFEQVKELNDKKDEFIGLASHELKTPLTSISGYLQLLSTIVTDAKAQRFVSKTRLQVKKLSMLVADLLDVSKIEAGKLRFAVERFNIRQVLVDVIELFSHGHNNYRITLETNLAELQVSGDPNRIEQVINNLLTNAIRYSPGTNQIIIYLVKEAGNVKIGIRDFGIGIAEEKLQDVFSRFYRVDDINSNISGLGIGLYLSHEIITRHHGKIWAESEPGVGSTFWFTLPLER
ncbi:MAG: Response sensor protein [Mucilaginibacter sp.]|uniref:sensor histidine kinase n=1 Tax=Mucilaginibacter sp. TaxID=1882438 RepID=UPI00262167EB|nr:PAS domain S-box protein [Mucilaginibacter sp.]MDB5004041.1 Response sensor protein [Mucilaginibacter sp.]